MSLETQYRALLRWYPRAWRAANEEVVLGTLLDTAEARGRARPTRSEAWSLRMNGLGERFSTSFAAIAAVLAIGTSFAGVTLLISGAGMTAVTAVLTAVTGIAFTAAVLGMLRDCRLLSPTRTVAALAVGACAWILGAMAGLSWSVGFDEADTGLAPTPLSAAFGPLLLIGWAFGAVAVLMLITGVSSAMPRALRYLAGLPGALILPPVLGIGATYQFVGMLGGCALLLLAGHQLHRRAPSTSTPREPAATISPGVRSWAVGLLALVLVVSVGGAVFAVLGAEMGPAIDGTRAMQLGLGVGQLAIIPLALCGAVVLSHRRLSESAIVGASAALTMLGSAWYATGNLVGSSAAGDIPWPALVLIATGIAVAVFGALRMRWPWRGLTAVTVAVCSLLPLWLLLQVAAFLLPLLCAALLVVVVPRRGRRLEAITPMPQRSP